MSIILGMLFGAVIGWLGSLVMKSDTNEAILIDILTGILGALPAASLLGNDATLDSVLAGGLGALVALVILYLVRSRLAGGPGG